MQPSSAHIDIASPEALAQFIEGRSDAAIEQSLAAVGIDHMLDRVLDGIASRFVPERSRGRRGLIQWVLETSEGQRRFQLRIEPDRCVVDRDASGRPDVSLTARPPVFLRMIAGRLNGMQAYTDGSLRVDGDLVLASLQQVFFVSEAGLAPMRVSTPAQLAQLIEGRSDREIEAGLAIMGVDSALEQIFQGMSERFLPERAGRTSAVVQWIIATSEGERRYHLTFDRGRCTWACGRPDKPRVTLWTTMPDFLRLIAGKLHGTQAVMQRRLKVRGNVFLAAKHQGWFDRHA
jgi:putative sterol carrier protein